VLATFAVWLTGKAAELRKLQRQYQANTVKTCNVLSIFYLGCRVLNKQTTIFRRKDPSGSESFNFATILIKK